MTMNPNYPCPVCGGTAPLFDVVDLNKSCQESVGKFLPLSGIPVYYARCEKCGFCFAPELMKWPMAEFEKMIYNDDYVRVDPDYIESRPRIYASNLIQTFGEPAQAIRHLDYGGGNGLLAKLLKTANWQSTSYDPFVDRDVKIEQLGKFDLITAFEVFEHVPDVHALMSDLRSLLAPNGVILFTTTLSDGRILPGQRINWCYASPRNGHIALFSRNSLLTLIKAYGFTLATLSPSTHIFFTQLPPWASHLILAE